MTFDVSCTGNITKEAGPVSMTFTIPMYNASKLQVIVDPDLVFLGCLGHFASMSFCHVLHLICGSGFLSSLLDDVIVVTLN